MFGSDASDPSDDSAPNNLYAANPKNAMPATSRDHHTSYAGDGDGYDSDAFDVNDYAFTQSDGEYEDYAQPRRIKKEGRNVNAAPVNKTLDGEGVPRMPCTPARRGKHREKITDLDSMVNACVARPVRPAEVKTNLKAQAAMQLEWDRLRAVPRDGGKAGVWDELLVREWRHVRREATGRGEKANVGLVSA